MAPENSKSFLMFFTTLLLLRYAHALIFQTQSYLLRIYDLVLF